MSGDWWISILGLCQFLWVYSLSILAVILIQGNEKRNRRWAGKGKQMRLNTTDENKEQVDFVHKPCSNQYLIIESRSNLTVGLFIL